MRVSVDIKRKVAAANDEFLKRVTSADPVLVDVVPAGEMYADFPEKLILHSGPPVTWQSMSGAQHSVVHALAQPFSKAGHRMPKRRLAYLRAERFGLTRTTITPS